MPDKIRNKIKEDFDNVEDARDIAKVTAKYAVIGPAVVPAVAVEAAADIAKDIPDKLKKAAQDSLIKKYNPLFWDDYTDPDFNLPNLVVIANDLERRDLEVCKGAIGWRSKQEGMEVLHIYDNLVDICGLTFVPAPICDAVYYVDTQQKTTFINVEDLYETIQQQKLAELTRVAYSLGAKSYSIEIVEEESVATKSKGKAGIKGNVKIVEADGSFEKEQMSETKRKRKAFRAETFTRTRKPVAPELRWFKEDHNILGLIDQVCNGDGSMKMSDIQIECSKSAVMAQTTAGKIDVAIKKMGIGTTANLQNEAKSEFASKILFHIEF